MTQVSTAQTNVQRIVRLEEGGERDRTLIDKISERIGHFAGTLGFVIFQTVMVTIWLVVNAGAVPSIPSFDPYPFGFLATVLGLEGVTLTAFVLIRQNRMSMRADRRNHLQLQINLLSEQEVTKVIQMLERMSQQMGIEAEVTDLESKELAADTPIEGIANELREHLEDGVSRERP